MMQFLKSILGTIRKTWTSVLAILGSITLLCACYFPLGKGIAWWLQGQISAGAGSAHPSIKGLPSHLIAAGVLFCFFLIILTVYMAVAWHRDSAPRAERDVLLKTFRRSTKAADLICGQLFPGAAVPVKKVISFKLVLTFYENGDCQWHQEMKLAAGTRDIHLQEMEFSGEDEAAPADFPDDIDLKVTPVADQRLTYLISANEARKKKLVVFFLPFIQAGGRDQREVITTFYWRGLMGKLFSARREEEFTDRVESVAPVPEIEYQFWIKPRLGELVCTQIGQIVTGEKLVRLGRNSNGMAGWVYRATNVPVGHETRLRLELH